MVCKGDFAMGDTFMLSEEGLARIEPFFPLPRGVAPVDDCKVISGTIHVIRNGPRWRDAPLEYGSCKALYNRFKRWSGKGLFDEILKPLGCKQSIHHPRLFQGLAKGPNCV